MAITLDNTQIRASFDVSRAFAPPTGGILLRIPTTRFGTLEVEEDLIITLTDGIIGLSQCRRFIVVRHDDSSAFRWLQSLEEPGIAFPVIEPGAFRADYAPVLSEADVRALDLSSDSAMLVFVIVTIPPDNPPGMTANLLAPIVINSDTRQGKQVILQDQGYTTRHTIVEELKRLPLQKILPQA